MDTKGLRNLDITLCAKTFDLIICMSLMLMMISNGLCTMASWRPWPALNVITKEKLTSSWGIFCL